MSKIFIDKNQKINHPNYQNKLPDDHCTNTTYRNSNQYLKLQVLDARVSMQRQVYQQLLIDESQIVYGDKEHKPNSF